MDLLKKIANFIWTKRFAKHLGIIVLVYVLVVSAVVFYLDSFTNHGQKISVPNLIGKNVKSVQSVLEASNLKYEVLDSIYDPSLVEGTIIDQDPAATSVSTVFVKENRIIRVRVSKRSRLVEMPSLIDKSIRFAESVLKNRGLRYKIVYKPSSESNGAVLDQLLSGKRIKEGVKIPIGSMITVIVGRNEGGQPVSLPNLYGLTIFEARERLANISTLNYMLICPDCISYEDSLMARIESQTPEYVDSIFLVPAGTTITVYARKNFQGGADIP
jgi:beta-lactam-binding protein with PASTA domain